MNGHSLTANDAQPRVPSALALRAYAQLAYADLIRLRGFRQLRDVMAGTPTCGTTDEPREVIDATLRALDRASILYPRPVYCLQRSVAVTRLLRRQGVAAELVIGCTVLPMKVHAWVEVAGAVVSGHQVGLPFYLVLDRW